MSVPVVRVLDQREMQEQLTKLAACHKQAKLQELFERQDELRPFTNNQNATTSSNDHQTPSRQQSDQEIEAMKTQFTCLHRKQLDKQTSKQFLLRVVCDEVDDEQGEKRNIGYGSDGSGEIKVDEKDVAAMKEDFNKQQKSLLKTQIERSFYLTTPGCDEADEFDFIDIETEEKLIEDSEEMKNQYKELNKVMVRLRSMKTLEMGMMPQIKPQHKEQFECLLKDIGIVNEHIIKQLWMNIESTVNEDDNTRDDNSSIPTEDGFEEEEDDMFVEDRNDMKDKLIQRLRKENESLHTQLAALKQEVETLPVDDMESDDDDEVLWLD